MAIVSIGGIQTLTLGQPAAPLQVTDTAKKPFALDLFPLGEYFHRTAGWLPPTAAAFARFWSRLLRRKRAFERNMDPRQADELLDEWESAYAVPQVAGATDDDRRAAVLTQVRALGGVTAAYYEALAADFGYVAAVTDAADPFTTISLCDDFLAGGEWKLTFLVTTPSQTAARDNLLVELINGQLLAGWFALYNFT